MGADEWRMTNALSYYRPQKQPISPRQNEIRLLKIKREKLEMINISQEDVDFIMQEIQKNKLQKKFLSKFLIFFPEFQFW